MLPGGTTGEKVWRARQETPMTAFATQNWAHAAAFFGTIVLGLAATGAAAQETPAGLDTLVRNFERMAFREEAEVPEFLTLERWARPVRAVLQGEGAGERAPAVRALFAEYEALTGLEFTLVEADAQAGLEIFFSDRAWYSDAVAMRFDQPERVQCFSNTMTTQGRIVRAFAAIPGDLRSADVEACLAHELMHTLGFKGHPERSLRSALRSGRAARALTINDRILIRTLYDARLAPGMSREEAVHAAREVIAGLLGRLKDAGDPIEALSRRKPVEWWRMEQAGA